VLGVCLGFPFLIACVGLGLGKIFEIFPALYTALKVAGAAYMLWLAYKVATSTPEDKGQVSQVKPVSFLQGAAFQWVNVKGWIMAITALSTYTRAESYGTGVAIIVAVYVFMGFTSASAWAMFGVALKSLLSNPRWFRFINYGLAVLLVASLAPMLWH
jgi:threonine/homoserine/homoserine lactone efflux protein